MALIPIIGIGENGLYAMNMLVTQEEYDKYKEKFIIPKYSIEIEFLKVQLTKHSIPFEVNEKIATIMVGDDGRIMISSSAVVCSVEMVKAICEQCSSLNYPKLIDNYAEHLKTV